MSDELTKRFPSDPSDEASESPEQRAARAVGLDALQFAALPSMERYMLVFMTEIAARLERVETKFDERSRQTMPLSESIQVLINDVRAVKDTLNQVNDRLGHLEREVREINREMLNGQSQASRNIASLDARLSRVEDQQHP